MWNKLRWLLRALSAVAAYLAIHSTGQVQQIAIAIGFLKLGLSFDLPRDSYAGPQPGQPAGIPPAIKIDP